MRVIIAGSRKVYGPQGVEDVKRAITESTWNVNEIISGHADGVDKIGEEIAKERGIDLVIFPANWEGYGKAAGFKRNEKMAWYANIFNVEYKKVGLETECPDKLKGGLIAVWDGKSAGTKNMIEIAKRAGLPYFVYNLSERG